MRQRVKDALLKDIIPSEYVFINFDFYLLKINNKYYMNIVVIF